MGARTWAAAILVGLVALAVAPPVSAATVSGSLTSSDPTYWRYGNGNTGCLVHSGGASVYYDIYPLSVSVTGGFDIGIASSPASDSFLTIYFPSFDPANAVTNCYARNDDRNVGSNFLDALISNLSLSAGVQYFAVVTSYVTLATFDYTLTATASASNTTGGVATIGALPEPTTFGLLGLGLAGLAATRRRKQ